MEESNLAILVVEDDPRVARTFSRILEQGGYRPEVASCLSEARARLAARRAARAARYAVVLLDLRLPDGDGEDLLPELEVTEPPPAVVVVSATVDAERAVRLLHKGIPTIPKPIEREALLALVARLSAESPPKDLIGTFCQAHRLSARETEVVRLATAGMSTANVATHLRCSAGTVATHWQRIFHKTGCHAQPSVFAAALRFLGAANAPRQKQRP